MLTGGDCDLNSSTIDTDSCNDVMRQTILNQELAFRNQVKELHRLYTIQNTLMNGVGGRELKGHNSGKVSTESTVDPFINRMSCESLATGKTSAISLAGSVPFVNNNCLQQDTVICSKLQRRPHDLQLLHSRHITTIGTGLLKKGNIWDSVEKPVETKRYSCGDNISCPEEVRLSLSIGGDIIENSSGKGTWNDKPTYFSSRPIIDLEESTERALNEKHVSAFGFDAPITPEQKHDSRVPGQPSRNSRNSFVINASPVTDSFVNGSESYRKRGSFCLGDISYNMSFLGKRASSYEPLGFDLNKVLVDESSSFTDNPKAAYPSTSNSSDGLIGECNGGSCSTAASATLKEASGPPLKLNEKPRELTQVDVLTHNAAMSLFNFSSQSPLSAIVSVGSNEIKIKEQPQRSLDSYESSVLKLAENETNDYRASSRPFEVEELCKRDCGIKLTRGRRMKDFQKDVLPGLSSLSRHEIWEDVTIMERALRSREYKEHISKMANEANWFTPVRSKRSKLNYVGRKYHS